MKIGIKKTLAVAALALGGSIFSANSQALSISLTGSSTIGTSGASITGSDLSAPGSITIPLPFYGTNTGDFSPIPALGVFTLGTLDLSNPSSWNILGPAASFGTYAVSQLIIINPSFRTPLVTIAHFQSS
jgi:hypothetical protein